MMRIALFAIIAWAHVASAQLGRFAGTIYRDSLDHTLTGTEITITALDRRTVSNYLGEFRLTGLPFGHYTVVLRHIGFAVITDTVTIGDERIVLRDYELAPQATTLDSVRVTAAVPVAVPFKLREYTERRDAHTGGYFIDDSTLRKNESRKLQDVITSFVPGVRRYQSAPMTQPSAEYLSSGRGTCDGPVLMCRSWNCPVTLYIDGAVAASSVPDLNSYSIGNIAAVEYYAGGASVPIKYNATGNGCGVLLLWTRDR